MLEAPILRWFAFPHQQILLYQSGTAKIGVKQFLTQERKKQV